jgi:hypothetical protein
MLKQILILICFSTLISECFSQDKSQDDLLRNIVKQSSQAEVIIPFNKSADLQLLTENVSIASVNNGEIRIFLSPLTVEWFISQNFKYQIVSTPEVKGYSSAESIDEALEWDYYPTYSQYVAIMHKFAGDYPELCRLDTIGTTNYGKLVLALKISDNAPRDEDETEVFYSSTMHGNETSGFILMMRFADYLLSNYNSVDRVRRLVNNLEIWINPVANPDGTYGTGDIMTNPVRFNARGYDLNRNFPDPDLPSNIPNQQKETADMVRFLAEHRFMLSANFHSGSEIVNYPWDKWNVLHADDHWFYEISRDYADTVHVYSDPNYMSGYDNGVVRGYVWYKVNGSRQDFVTYELQGREVTIELDNTYVTPVTRLDLLWQYNYHSFIGYLENALYGIHGKVVDEQNSAPLAAKVFIPGHDKDNSFVYSDTIYGSFTRLISPGNWDLTFSAEGYRDTTIRNVAVIPFTETDMLVRMEPLWHDLQSPLLFPNPASSELNAVLPASLAGEVEIKIYNTAGMLCGSFKLQAQSSEPLKIDISSLSSGVYTISFRNNLTGKTGRQRFIRIR